MSRIPELDIENIIIRTGKFYLPGTVFPQSTNAVVAVGVNGDITYSNALYNISTYGVGYLPDVFSTFNGQLSNLSATIYLGGVPLVDFSTACDSLSSLIAATSNWVPPQISTLSTAIADLEGTFYSTVLASSVTEAMLFSTQSTLQSQINSNSTNIGGGISSLYEYIGSNPEGSATSSSVDNLSTYVYGTLTPFAQNTYLDLVATASTQGIKISSLYGEFYELSSYAYYLFMSAPNVGISSMSTTVAGLGFQISSLSAFTDYLAVSTSTTITNLSNLSIALANTNTTVNNLSNNLNTTNSNLSNTSSALYSTNLIVNSISSFAGGDVSTYLSNYATTSNLSTLSSALSNYATLSNLSTLSSAFSNYATTGNLSTLSSALSNYATLDNLSTLSSALSNYATGNNISTLSTLLNYGNVHIGSNAGLTSQGANAVAIGSNAGQIIQAANTVAIGASAGYSNQQEYAVAVGSEAGMSSQSNYAVAVGYQAGSLAQRINSLAIGYRAGYSNQAINSIALGARAGEQTQSQEAIAVGVNAGQCNQGQLTFALGTSAGVSSQQQYGLAMGTFAGRLTQGYASFAIGTSAGEFYQGPNSIAIGTGAGVSTQGANCIAFGNFAGAYTQSNGAIAFGANAGYSNQGLNAAAIGTDAGISSQSQYAIAVGNQAGLYNQGQYGIAIGTAAGKSNQGTNSIALGFNAGLSNQSTNTIILNASGSSTEAISSSSFYVRPVRNSAGAAYLGYDATTYEVSYSVAAPSDGRVKENISSANLDFCYSTLAAIPMKTFNFISSFAATTVLGTAQQIGVVAQDIERLLENAVRKVPYAEYDDFRTLNSDQLLFTVMGAVKRLQERVEALERHITP